MKTKKISIKLNAVQFEKGDTAFAGGQVRNLPKINKETGKPYKEYEEGIDEAPFAITTINGSHVRLDEGQWIVTFPDGKQEVWSDEKLKASGSIDPDDTDARLDDEEIKAQAADKLVVDYKEHNPKINATDGNAPVTGTEESKKSAKKK